MRESLEPISLEALMAKEFPKVRWVVEKIIPAEGMVAISGLPSVYKTWLVLDLAVKVARGEALFDRFETNQTGVLIVDEETGERWVQDRMSKLEKTFDLPIYILSKRGVKLTKETVNELVSFVKSRDVGLVIFDSLVRVHTARDENSAVEMAKVFSFLQEFAKEGVAVVFTHHNRKRGILRSSNLSQEMRGSSDILAAVDCHLAVERKKDFLTVTQTKLRHGGEEAKPFKLDVVSDENDLRFEFVGEVDEKRTRRGDFKEAIKDVLEQEGIQMYKGELFNALKAVGVKGGRSTFKSAVQEMVEEGELFERSGGRNKVFCSLKPFEQKREEQQS